MATVFSPSASSLSNYQESDTSLNNTWTSNKFDTQSSFVADLFGGVAATVVDAGASMWNSMPFTENVETADLLARVSENALRVYEENPDTIHTASLIAGAFVPGTLALKGMNAMRNGSKAVNWFSTAGKEASMKEVSDLVAMGKKGTDLYKQTLRGVYARGVANEVVDAAAAEALMLGTMSAHPLLEDYWDDPAKNFGLSLAFGGVIGAGAGHIADRFALKAMNGAVEENAFANTIGKLTGIKSDMSNAVVLQTQQANIENLEGMLLAGSKKGQTPENSLEMAIASRSLMAEKGQQKMVFEKALGAEMKGWDQEAKDELLKNVANNPAFHHVETMRALTEKQVQGLGLSLTKTKAAPEPVLSAKNRAGVEVEKPAVYDPVHQVFLPVREAPNYAGAATLSSDVNYHASKLGSLYGRVPNKDWDMEVLVKSAAETQSEFVGAIAKYSGMSLEQLRSVEIAENDLAGLTAVFSKLSSEPQGFRTKVKIAGTKAEKATTVFETQLTQNLTPDGRPIKYADGVRAIASPQAFAKYDIYDTAKKELFEDGDVNEYVRGWVAGNGSAIRGLRRGASDYFSKGFAAVKELSQKTNEYRIFDKVYNSPQSTSLREYMRTLADKDGNVILYRGWHVDPKDVQGQATLTSYALEPSKAEQFIKGGGKVGVYRVHVDDIVAGINDVGGGSSHAEIIVHAGARPVEATLDAQGRAQFFQGKQPALVTPLKQQKTPDYFLSEVKDMLIEGKETLINSMLKAGTPLVTISMKTNTPLKTVEAFSVGANTLDELHNVHGFPINIFDTLEQAKETIKDKNKAFIVSGNINKNPYAAAKGNLDKQLLDQANNLMVETTLRSAKLGVLDELADSFFINNKRALDIARAQIGAVNNSYAGRRFFESFDSYSRNMKDVGVVAGSIGKEIERLTQKQMDKVIAPISSKISPIVSDPAALTEMNIFVQLHSSLSGRRVYKDRVLYKEVDALDVNGKPIKTLEPVDFQGQPFQIKSDSVDALLNEMQKESVEMLSLANAYRKLIGKAPVNDIGFWMPSVNPINKAIAYIHNTETDGVSMLYANTTAELQNLMDQYATQLRKNGMHEKVQIVPKSQQEYWSRLNGRNDGVTMENAALDLQKTGAAASPVIKPTADIFTELVGGYQHYVTAQMRNIADASMSDLTGVLRRMSEENQFYYKNQPLTKTSKALQQPEDSAKVVLNTLLGNSNLGEYKGWESVNSSFENALAIGAMHAGNAWNTFVQPIKKGLFSSTKELDPTKLKKLDYEEYTKMLEEKGVPNPFAIFDQEAANMYNVAKLEDSRDISKRLVYGGNALAATMLLRFGDLAQPLVNMMSLPILTSLTAASKMPETFLGVQKGTANVGIVQVMHEGVRAMNSSVYKRLDDKWKEKGYYDAIVSEANSVMRATRSFEKGAIASVENALDSTLVKVMSKPADFAESYARRTTMFTGYMLAKKLYPELDEAGATIFAKDFLDRSIGNFHASQRPVFFQGTMGVALGLFQTYMLTLAQGVYRNLETKNYKALGKATLAQGTIFGASSLPGFSPVSEAIGEYYSDDHVDLESGTFRALPDSAAQMLLYGLPSNLTGAGLNTRGDISIRPPNVLAGVNNVVAVDFVSQAFTALNEFRKAATSGDDTGQALMQAMSIQSMSRPIARLAELGTGYSITREGNTVQVPEEVITPMGILARVLSTRPLAEVQLRQAMHLNSYYGSIDLEARKKVTAELKTAIRNDSLSDEKISALAEAYFEKNGTANGWRAAVNEALGRTESEGKEYFMDKLKPDSPLQYMISSLD